MGEMGYTHTHVSLPGTHASLQHGHLKCVARQDQEESDFVLRGQIRRTPAVEPATGAPQPSHVCSSPFRTRRGHSIVCVCVAARWVLPQRTSCRRKPRLNNVPSFPLSGLVCTAGGTNQQEAEVN